MDWPAALLVKPLENIRVTDARLKLPTSCLAALAQAGIVSFSRLIWWMEEAGGLHKIPRIGKPTATEIGDLVRAFLEARDDYETRKLEGE